MKTGKRMELCRNMCGLSQAQASKRLGIAQSSLSAYERDEREPTARAIRSMARVYGVSADFILGLVDETELSRGGFLSLKNKG